jgi:hypothetical protein
MATLIFAETEYLRHSTRLIPETLSCNKITATKTQRKKKYGKVSSDFERNDKFV